MILVNAVALDGDAVVGSLNELQKWGQLTSLAISEVVTCPWSERGRSTHRC